MADFTITIDCNSAAWFDNPQAQFEDVMAQITTKVSLNMACGSKLVLRDFNGNPTGLCTVAPITFGHEKGYEHDPRTVECSCGYWNPDPEV